MNDWLRKNYRNVELNTPRQARLSYWFSSKFHYDDNYLSSKIMIYNNISLKETKDQRFRWSYFNFRQDRDRSRSLYMFFIKIKIIGRDVEDIIIANCWKAFYCDINEDVIIITIFLWNERWRVLIIKLIIWGAFAMNISYRSINFKQLFNFVILRHSPYFEL